MKKRLLNTLLCLWLIVALLPTAALAADDAHVHEANNPNSDCIVCQVAGMINALPDAEHITLDNAAAVINQIHAIDRVKVQLTDNEYDALLLLVNQGNNGSGGGLGVPVDYMDAVKKIRKFGGNSLYISKSFAGYDSSDISDIEVEFIITGDNGFSQALTMSTMDHIPNSLSADSILSLVKISNRR